METRSRIKGNAVPFALDAIRLSYQKNEKLENAQDLEAAVNKLFGLLQNPSAYNAPMFAAQLQKVKTLLPAAK